MRTAVGHLEDRIRQLNGPTRESRADATVNVIIGYSKQPTKKELASVLGRTDGLWRMLVSELKRDLKLDRQEWNSYSIKAGWSLRLQSKQRNIVYLGPRQGYFLAAFILGAKAVVAARKSKLPQRS